VSCHSIQLTIRRRLHPVPYDSILIGDVLTKAIMDVIINLYSCWISTLTYYCNTKKNKVPPGQRRVKMKALEKVQLCGGVIFEG